MCTTLITLLFWRCHPAFFLHHIQLKLSVTLCWRTFCEGFIERRHRVWFPSYPLCALSNKCLALMTSSPRRSYFQCLAPSTAVTMSPVWIAIRACTFGSFTLFLSSLRKKMTNVIVTALNLDELVNIKSVLKNCDKNAQFILIIFKRGDCIRTSCSPVLPLLCIRLGWGDLHVFPWRHRRLDTRLKTIPPPP